MSFPEFSPKVKPQNLDLNLKNTQVKTKYGHFPYEESDANELMIVSVWGEGENQRLQKLNIEVATELIKLISTARRDGIWIFPVSGFRSIDYQRKLFEKQILKKGTPEAAAKLTAPPGYSEHHTGYTIDLGDGNFPQLDITEEFAQTPAFKWLKIHGKDFGFELSFPKDNFQGIDYEPWHWRYIGSPKAKEIFHIARIKKN